MSGRRHAPDYDWATNSQLFSPCILTAYIGIYRNLQPNQSYTNPNSSTANLSYNLISACTACQGFDSAVENWAAYDQNCTRTWNDGHFNTAQAKLIAQKSHKKSKPPVGAIVGGVIGGVAVLVIGGAIAFLFIRKRKPEQTNEGGTHPYLTRPPHGRSVSDLSGKSILIPRSLSMANSQRPGTIYTTNTIHTHTGSERYVPDTGDHARRNPPAYSPYPSPASSPEPVDPTPSSPRGDFAPGHRTRREKASVDTQQSYDSSPSHNGGESISAIDDVIGRMGLTMAPESVVGSTMGAQT
ncbi:hypothetical protein B0H14DRAFT_3005000, partial [Mycena olivaceomarginata]